jgi:hypothetical protein
MPESDAEDQPRRMAALQREWTPRWMKLPGVVGTGVGVGEDGAPCLRVFLAAPVSREKLSIPERVGGVAVEIVVTGAFGLSSPSTPPPHDP